MGKRSKKIIALGCAVLAALSCQACQPPEGMYSVVGQDLPQMDVVPIRIWCTDESVGLVTEMVAAYEMQNSTVNYDIVIEAKSEEDAAAILLSDPMSAPEVFMYSSEQIGRLIDSNVFTLVTRNKSKLTELNSSGAMNGAKPDEWLYGYPVAVNSEMLLFYDKSVIGEGDTESLDALLKAAQGAGKGVYMDLADGDTFAGFFLGAGCTLGYNKAGKLTCDFSSEKGLIAAEAIAQYAPGLRGGGAEHYIRGAADTYAAGVVSSDYAQEIKEVLGADFGAAPLPVYQSGGERYQLHSLGSYRYLGLRKMMDVDLAPYVMDLCYYLVDAENQYQRAAKLGWAATGQTVLEYPEYAANPVLAAMTVQSSHSSPRSFVPAGYYPAVAEYMQALQSSGGDTQALLAELSQKAVS